MGIVHWLHGISFKPRTLTVCWPRSASGRAGHTASMKYIINVHIFFVNMKLVVIAYWFYGSRELSPCVGQDTHQAGLDLNDVRY